MSSSICCFLTYIQFPQEAGQVVWYSRLFQNFPQFIMIHTVKGFGIVNKAKIDVFLNSLAFSMIHRVLAIWYLVPLPFLKPAWTSGSSQVHTLLKPGLENFEHYFTSVWDECNCAVVWAFFGIAFLWDWNENWPFPVLWPLLSFPNLLAYWVQHFHSIIFQDLNIIHPQMPEPCFLVARPFLFSKWELWDFSSGKAEKRLQRKDLQRMAFGSFPALSQLPANHLIQLSLDRKPIQVRSIHTVLPEVYA